MGTGLFTMLIKAKRVIYEDKALKASGFFLKKPILIVCRFLYMMGNERVMGDVRR